MYSQTEFVNQVREQFPFFSNNKDDWVLFENAGGSQTLKGVIERIVDYLSNANVQLRANNQLSDDCMKKVMLGVHAVGLLLNAKEPEREICLGSSSTQLLFNLSQAMGSTLPADSEIILTNCDHETNIGCWRRMAKQQNLVVREWQINKKTFELEIPTLESMLNEKTSMVAFTHCSNLLGTINPVEEYIKIIRKRCPKAIIVVDGVALAAHRCVDVQKIDADFYVFSIYKTFGPHIAALHGKRERMEALDGINHFYVTDSPRNIQPGNCTYEFAYSLKALTDYYIQIGKSVTEIKSAHISDREYLESCFQAIANHEEILSNRLFDFLLSRRNSIKVIGSESSSKHERVPTISFVVRGYDSKDICEYLSNRKIAAKYGECYCKRMTDYLNLSHTWGSQNGVVRISMVHYNSLEDVDRLVTELTKAIDDLAQYPSTESQ